MNIFKQRKSYKFQWTLIIHYISNFVVDKNQEREYYVSWKRGSKNQGTSQKVQINESGEISIEQTYNISGTLFTKRGRSNFYRKPLEFFLESSRSRKTLGSCVFDLAEVSTLENNSTLSKELNFRIKYQTEPLKLKFTIQSLPLDSTSLSIDTSASTSGEISSRQNSLISEDTYHDFRSDLDSDNNNKMKLFELMFTKDRAFESLSH
eukprot:gb/GECH01007929.1/.p1 GENE.gb/GECH01007929.1/~~gb/GECH01007929.1/.p1  ORF type:complete len:207 (+),score=37.84 gb/GECH01007929.1/:1-621(+)